MNKDCSVVVSSCDAYSDAWEPFFKLFFKYWPDCPFPIYLISEHKLYKHLKVNSILLGVDKKWATNMKLALNQIDSSFIIYMQEDYLLTRRVDTILILDFINIIKQNNIGYIKLYPSPPPTKIWSKDNRLGVIEKGSNDSVSLQSTMWNKSFLEKFLVDGESGWDMEIKGSKRTAGIPELFLSVLKGQRAIDYYSTAIKKGVWFRDAVWLIKREGIRFNSKRKVESLIDYFFRITGLRIIINKIKRINRDKLVVFLKRNFPISANLFYRYKRLFKKKYKKTYSQLGEDLLVKSALDTLGQKKITYLDIGAHSPIYLSNTYYFYSRGDTGVCIEPDPDLFKKFLKIRRRDTCLQVGISHGRSGFLDFYKMSASTLNTFSKEQAELMERTTSHKIIKVLKIPTLNINEVIKKYFVSTPNFISIDTEGDDLLILKSFDFNKYRPEVFCVETLTYTEGGLGKKVSEIIDFMLIQDYFVYADTHLNTIFVDKRKIKQ